MGRIGSDEVEDLAVGRIGSDEVEDSDRKKRQKECFHWVCREVGQEGSLK